MGGKRWSVEHPGIQTVFRPHDKGPRGAVCEKWRKLDALPDEIDPSHETAGRQTHSNHHSHTWLASAAAAAAVGGSRGQEGCGADEPEPAVRTLRHRHRCQGRPPSGCRRGDWNAPGDDKRCPVQPSRQHRASVTCHVERTLDPPFLTYCFLPVPLDSCFLGNRN